MIVRVAGEARLRLIISCIDLTSLDGDESAIDLRRLCARAVRPLGNPEIPSTAAVCIYREHVPLVKKFLHGTAVAVATVAGDFPAGGAARSAKLAEVEAAIRAGADEVDFVADLRPFFAGEDREFRGEIEAAKSLCGERIPLKVILETSVLGTADAVRRASDLALQGGATMLKTSTGKRAGGATPSAARAMCDAVAAYFQATGERRGLKFSGGLRTAAAAREYAQIVEEKLGADWLSPTLLRFGASALLDAVAMELAG